MKSFFSSVTNSEANTIEEALDIINPGDYVGIRALRFDGDYVNDDYMCPCVCKVVSVNRPRNHGFLNMNHDYGSYTIELANGQRYSLDGFGHLNRDLYAILLVQLDTFAPLGDFDPNKHIYLSELPKPTRVDLSKNANGYILEVYETALETKEAIEQNQACIKENNMRRMIGRINREKRQAEQIALEKEKAEAEKKAREEVDDLFKNLK